MSQEHQVVSLEDQLDALFGQYTAGGQARGLVYGLVGPEGLVHSAGFGVANDAGDVPDLDTLFPIASLTKSFVAAAALAARDRGLVDLDAPITDFFPQFSSAGASGTHAGEGVAAGSERDDDDDAPTLRMLLSMGGGLTEDNSWVDPFIDTPVDEMLAVVSEGVRYSNTPGAVFEYSNLGFALAGLAVGRATDTTIEEWARNEIMVPLGLHSTRFDNDPELGEHPGVRAAGYHLDPHGQWVAYPPSTSAAFASAGGICSTVRDLAAWVTWLGEAYRPYRESLARPLRRASRREMQRLHHLMLPTIATRADGSLGVSIAGYGLGVGVREDLLRGTIISHSGGLPGFLLYMIWHPDSGHGIVMLSNSHRGNPIALAEEALFRVLDRHATPARTVHLWPETRDLQRQADALIRRWDDDLAAEIFAENIDFDRPLAERRAEIEELIAQVGPLGAPGEGTDIVSATSAADVTWAIPGARGELLCMIHLTPETSPRIQELEVHAASYNTPRSARRTDISPRRKAMGAASLSSLPNTRVCWPK